MDYEIEENGTKGKDTHRGILQDITKKNDPQHN
jgi:hypothetical protein